MDAGRPSRHSTDFPLLLRSLAHRGFTRSAIARELHVAPSTVGRWLTAECAPRFNNGAGLLFLATDFAKAQKRRA